LGKHGATDGGHHGLGSAKALAQISETFAEILLEMEKKK